jgi:hypothetical protein
MTEVHAIFEAFGGPTPIADATGFPLQTVCDWRKKGNPEIPPWRRAAVLEAANRLKLELPPEAVAYLGSNERRRAA